MLKVYVTLMFQGFHKLKKNYNYFHLKNKSYSFGGAKTFHSCNNILLIFRNFAFYTLFRNLRYKQAIPNV